jgi:hypothetical protein
VLPGALLIVGGRFGVRHTVRILPPSAQVNPSYTRGATDLFDGSRDLEYVWLRFRVVHTFPTGQWKANPLYWPDEVRPKLRISSIALLKTAHFSHFQTMCGIASPPGKRKLRPGVQQPGL